MRELLDAAVAVAAAGGLRGLTHRAVDARAGVPLGTTSAYLRTRLALHLALARYVTGRLVDDIEALSRRLGSRPADSAYAVDQTNALFTGWLREGDLVVVRLELSLEASREPELAAVFGVWRERLVDVVADVVRASGRPEPHRRAEVTVSALEGVLLAALLKPARARPRYVRETVAAVIEALASHP